MNIKSELLFLNFSQVFASFKVRSWFFLFQFLSWQKSFYFLFEFDLSSHGEGDRLAEKCFLDERTEDQISSDLGDKRGSLSGLGQGQGCGQICTSAGKIFRKISQRAFETSTANGDAKGRSERHTTAVCRHPSPPCYRRLTERRLSNLCAPATVFTRDG